MSAPVKIATLTIPVTLNLPYRETLAALNVHHGWSGDPKETSPPELVEATYRALRSHMVTLSAALHSDGSWTIEKASES